MSYELLRLASKVSNESETQAYVNSNLLFRYTPDNWISDLSYSRRPIVWLPDVVIKSA